MVSAAHILAQKDLCEGEIGGGEGRERESEGEGGCAMFAKCNFMVTVSVKLQYPFFFLSHRRTHPRFFRFLLSPQPLHTPYCTQLPALSLYLTSQ